MTGRSIALFAAAALAEIAGAYLIWVGLREGKGPLAVVVGAFALVLYGLIAAQQSSNEFGRVLAGLLAACSLWARCCGASHSMVFGRTTTTWRASSSASRVSA